jgi:hypothetical protein
VILGTDASFPGLSGSRERLKASYPRDDNPPNGKKAGNDPASTQSLW